MKSKHVLCLVLTALMLLSVIPAAGLAERKSNENFAHDLNTVSDSDALFTFGTPAPSNHRHIWGPWVTIKKPTCYTQGLEQRTCKLDPSHVETRTIPASHNWGDWETLQEQTCTQDGIYQRVCKRDSSHVGTSVRPATGHDFTPWHMVIKPTFKTPGVYERTCKKCGYVEQETKSAPVAVPEYSIVILVEDAILTEDDTEGYQPAPLTYHVSEVDPEKGLTISYFITLINNGKKIWYADEVKLGGNRYESIGREIYVEPGSRQTFIFHHQIKREDLKSNYYVGNPYGYESLSISVDAMVTDDTHDGSVGESNVVNFEYTFIDDTGETGWGTELPEEEYRYVEMRLEALNSSQQYGGYSLGEKVNLRCTVTNLSATDTITDALLYDGSRVGHEGQLNEDIATVDGLAPGESKSYDFTYTIEKEDVKKGQVTLGCQIDWVDKNSTIKEEPDQFYSNELVISTIPDPGALCVTLEVDSFSRNMMYYEVGETVELLLYVLNRSIWTDTAIREIDVHGFENEYQGNNPELPCPLLPEDIEVFQIDHTVTELDALRGYIECSVTVYARDPDGNDYPFTSNLARAECGELPEGYEDLVSIHMDEISIPKNGGSYMEDELIKYRVTIKNTGTEPIHGDSQTSKYEKLKLLRTVDLAPGEQMSYEWEYHVSEIDVYRGTATSASSVRFRTEDGTLVSKMSNKVTSKTGFEIIVRPGGFRVPSESRHDDHFGSGRFKYKELEERFIEFYPERFIKIKNALQSKLWKAVGRKAIAKVWTDAQSEWKDELASVYTEAANTAGSELAIYLMQDELVFDEFLDSYIILTDAIADGQTDKAAKSVSDLLEDYCRELYVETNGVPEEWSDDAGTKPLQVWPGNTPRKTEKTLVEANGNTVTYSVTYRPDHIKIRTILENQLSMTDRADDRAVIYRNGYGMWKIERDRILDEQLRKGNDAQKNAITGYIRQFDRMAEARRAVLERIYDETPDLTERILCEMMEQQVILLDSLVRR